MYYGEARGRQVCVRAGGELNNVVTPDTRTAAAACPPAVGPITVR